MSGPKSGAERVAFVSFLWAAVVAAAKLAVALKIGSVALLGDGLHSALDMVATAVTFGAVRWAAMPPDREHPYGHGRAENLAALGEAALMVVMAGVIALEAALRLRRGTVIEVHSYALWVVVGAIAVDASRAWSLRRAAKRYASPALEADAMNFTADIAESTAVLIGLGAARLGFDAGDPIAAFVVSAAMVVMGIRVGRSAFSVLMDRQHPALAEQVTAAAGAVPGVVEVGDVRVRRSGAVAHAEMTVTVPRTSSVEQSHGITEAVEAAVARAAPGTSATVHVEPSSEGEDVVVRTFAAANRIGMADQVHNVTAIEHPEGMWLTLHAKVAPDMPLARAHDITDALEHELRSEIHGLARVEIHLEPREPSPLHGAVVTADHGLLIDAVREICASHRPITTCHEVAVSEAEDGLHLVVHCEAPPGESIAHIHDASLAVEDEIHRRFGDVRAVTIHFEPDGTR
jgi:cation diffusion facilitator family transporter